jgi:hypothetical protein
MLQSGDVYHNLPPSLPDVHAIRYEKDSSEHALHHFYTAKASGTEMGVESAGPA